MQMTVKSIFSDWAKALKVEELKNDLNRIAEDLGRVKKSIAPQARHTLRQAEREYRLILKQLAMAQKQWNLEVRKAGVFLKKSTNDIEGTLQHYRDLAVQQKNEIQKAILQSGNGKTQNTRSSARGKKASAMRKKTAKKASRKIRGGKSTRSSGATLH